MWFESYLRNRRQRVFLNNVSSDWEISNCGVPQGSILGPLLFLIYINDLPQNCNLNVLLFADDTNITSIGNSRAEISLELANADVFNKFFANVGEGLRNHLTAAHDVDIPNCVHSMFFFPTTKREVESVYRSLQNKSSSGDDLICNSIVKASMPATLNVITNLINRSFNEGLFPDSLKTAKIVPLFKDGPKSEENNYRAISLLIIWSKIFEKVVFNRVYGYFEKLGILSKYQFGFRDKHSTIDALVELSEKIRHSGKENAINSFFLDLKKAFDTINHNRLLKKLERYGIRGKCLMWFESYLRNRRQRVFLNNVSSDWEISNCGVPQGSILGPLLFLIYINDLPQNCNLNVLLFADDTNITSIGNSRAEISLELANADVFNKFFANVGEGLRNHLTAAHDVDIPNCVHSMFFFPTTKREVESVYRSLQNKSSSGDDLICNSIVKASMPATLNVITNLINRSFNEGLFPDSLKTAKIVPLFKDGSKSEENNYLPISLLIIWSKIFEKVVFNRVYGYFEKLGILSKYQFGFRDKHSTIDALVELTEKIRHSGKENAINSFFLDLKKAFDTINHNLLLKKLERYGIRGKCLMWFESYLRNRRQRVFLNNVSSDWEISNCGVPQGSILGPLLFLIYINDLPQNCNLNVLLFADDTNITSIGNSRAEISLELAKINNWLKSNKLVLNLEKTILMKMLVAGSKIDSSEYLFDDQVVQTHSMCKYLGVRIDAKLSFISHIERVKKKLSKQCGIVFKMRHFVPRLQLISYYSSNVIPIIQYGVLVYGCCSYSSLLPLFMLQKKVLKFISFRRQSDSCSDLFLKHGFLSVYELHIYELLKFVLKSICNFHSENYCNEMFQFSKKRRNTRQSELRLLNIPCCKRKLEKFSIKYRAAKLYNKLRELNLLPGNVEKSTRDELKNIYHKLKDSYLINNQELLNYMFEM